MSIRRQEANCGSRASTAKASTPARMPIATLHRRKCRTPTGDEKDRQRLSDGKIGDTVNIGSVAGGKPDQRPKTLTSNLTSLPAALKAREGERRWVAWRWTWREEQQRWDKPPLQVDGQSPAKSNAPSTWGSYGDAVAAVSAGLADGIGYMLADSDLGAVDLDHCRDPETGKISAWAQKEIFAAPGAYVEATVSGSGLRILGTTSGGEIGRRFKIPGETNGAAIEVYRRTNRYITISGMQIAGGDALPNIDHALDGFVTRYESKPSSTPRRNARGDIGDLIKGGAPGAHVALNLTALSGLWRHVAGARRKSSKS